MAPEPRRLSDEERALWARAAADVAPMAPAQTAEAAEAAEAAEPAAAASAPAPAEQKPRRRTPPKPKSAPPSAPKSAPKPAAASKPLSEDAPPELDRRQRRALRRGKLPEEATLDLHGMTQREAKAALEAFIESAQARGFGAVMVVTGKGGRGADGAPGVLRRMTPKWLSAEPLAARVIGTAAAAPGCGGEGALYVRLKKRRGARG